MLRTRIPRKDDKRIHEMIRAYLLPFKRTFFPEANMSRKEMIERLKRGATFVTAAGPNEPIDGFCHAMAKGDTLWIDLLAVDVRRRNKGRGSRLLRQAEAYGRRKRCRTSRLFVDEHNSAAQAFYRKHGYEPKEYVYSLRCYMYAKKIQGSRKPDSRNGRVRTVDLL